MSLHCGEDKSFSENPFNLSSVIFGNAESKHSGFSSTPLHDSLDHEDANEHREFSDRGFHDLCTPSFDHDDDSLAVNFSKPLVFDDLSSDEVETPIKALQLALIVMSGPCYPKVSSTSDQKSVETTKALYHSLVCIEDQSISKISFPPLESHDPIAHAWRSHTQRAFLRNVSFNLSSCLFVRQG